MATGPSTLPFAVGERSWRDRTGGTAGPTSGLGPGLPGRRREPVAAPVQPGRFPQDQRGAASHGHHPALLQPRREHRRGLLPGNTRTEPETKRTRSRATSPTPRTGGMIQARRDRARRQISPPSTWSEREDVRGLLLPGPCSCRSDRDPTALDSGRKPLPGARASSKRRSDGAAHRE